MNLTPYESGQRSPADLFPPERRRNVLERQAEPRLRGISEEERRVRMVLAAEVREMYDSTAEMARAVGVHGGTVKQWLAGVRPVPDKRVATLEKLSRGGK